MASQDTFFNAQPSSYLQKTVCGELQAPLKQHQEAIIQALSVNSKTVLTFASSLSSFGQMLTCDLVLTCTHASKKMLARHVAFGAADSANFYSGTEAMVLRCVY